MITVISVTIVRVTRTGKEEYYGFDRMRWIPFDEGYEVADTSMYNFRAIIALYTLEAHKCKKPTWRLQERILEYEDNKYSNIDEIVNTYERMCKRDPELSGYLYIKGIYANKPISKYDIVQLYPECRRMPLLSGLYSRQGLVKFMPENKLMKSANL